MKNCVKPQEDFDKFVLIAEAGGEKREMRTLHWIRHVL